ncbi:dihydroorotase [Amphibacillus sp. MSJ-3]|uniref:dihydroorotase n=1 Tax=Amphibacillus sp. MSJ-3 TaxID=2841505 RepID=UPI001C0F1F15|nr:dihydroorotase [Amphibacillus sp. MSJ-3]MBU5594622.1 dihydroorotase [Amphibacillus sp. MSJ-3]
MATIIKQCTHMLTHIKAKKIDIKIEQGKITDISEHITKKPDDIIIEADGKLIAPGFIDVHVHLREPGGEAKETIETGTRAAANGGYTTICAMPNTNPVPDGKENLAGILERINKHARVHVLPYGSITKGLQGKELVDFQSLGDQGVFAFTDDGVGIQTADQMLAAMRFAKQINKPIVAHCEDNSLINNGSVHQGEVSERLGVNGIPSICESVQIARDVLLAEATGCHYHVCHVSTKESVRVIRDAKRAGIHVTAEVTPHHLLLNETDIKTRDTNFKMNPPLRSRADQEALWEGLLDGTIDLIATDHAPHTAVEKSRTLEQAPFGIVGLETAFALLYTNFVQTGKCTLKQLIDWMTIKPADVFALQKGRLEIGQDADIVLIDLDHKWSITPEAFQSKGRNTPFAKWDVTGKPLLTIVNGQIVYREVEMI